MIVAGIDYSEDSRTALRWAVREGSIAGAPVTAVHAGPPVYDLVADTPYAAARRAAELPRLTEFVRPYDVGCRIVDGPPVEGLVAASRHADLLVVGRHGRGAIARVLMGSTSHAVVRRAACAVAVIPGGTGDAPATRVVVGTDGSEEAAAAVAWAAAEASRRDVPLVVVHAGTAAATAFLADTVEKLRADSGGTLQVAGSLSWLEPAPALLDGTTPDDILVVGERGHGGISRLLLGSTSSAVVAHSVCPAVVVPSAR